MSDCVKYNRDFFSHVSRGIIAPLWAAKESSPYLRHLKKLVDAPYRDLKAVLAEQDSRLTRLIAHAYDNTKYYKEMMDEAGVRPQDVTTVADLSKLPVLTKDAIRNQGDNMISGIHDRSKLRNKTTSGSTGVSLSLYIDEDSQQWKRACAVRHDMWCGWRQGEAIGAIWGNPTYKDNWRLWLRNALLGRMVYLDTLKMDHAAMLEFHEALLKKRPTQLFGHAHSLYLFAKFVKQNGLQCYQPKGIISTAMVLHDFERSLVEEAFKAKVFNRYGCEEVSLIASECEAHEGLHINMDTIILECVDPNGIPVAPGEVGAVVVTDLSNYGMPIIRYKVGDAARIRSEPCSCGRSYPLIESLEGRIADYVRTPDGEYISGISLTENFAMQAKGVKQLQIIQEAIDFIVLRVVKGSDWTSDSVDNLNRLVNQRFGEQMRHEIEYVDSIQSESSGKYRFCISKLEDQPF
ncbi:phenylacetate--CoA ligase family protein [Pseudodesulfovibrio cashew]|uniref:Phenylacetate--CoA ligase family protein n=1 Tax=Pseudodesulfovibrio cashew TaxID=2678688 RepID=A0A6I6JN93_9BACT|nr:phenylacetate--CoA ligase family protein [Pseudodesulfovibrio cashew]QGY39164.1 phenylacetate--CoA ligase family protein [Pseudodesulfovibrio cashew]